VRNHVVAYTHLGDFDGYFERIQVTQKEAEQNRKMCKEYMSENTLNHIVLVTVSADGEPVEIVLTKEALNGAITVWTYKE